jgi:hypothetical protein
VVHTAALLNVKQWQCAEMHDPASVPREGQGIAFKYAPAYAAATASRQSQPTGVYAADSAFSVATFIISSSQAFCC